MLHFHFRFTRYAHKHTCAHRHEHRHNTDSSYWAYFESLYAYVVYVLQLLFTCCLLFHVFTNHPWLVMGLEKPNKLD